MSGSIGFDPSQYDGSKEGEKRDFAVPEAGSEVALVVRADGTEWRTSNAGNKYLNVKLEVLNGASAGYWLWYTVPTGEYQMAFLGRLLTAMNIDITKKVEVSIDGLVGKRCIAKIRHETRNGGTKAVVNYFRPYDAEIANIKDAGASVKKRSAPKPPDPLDAIEDEGGVDDDDLPF